MTRSELLDELSEKFGEGIWRLASELEKTLRGLHKVDYFDLTSPAAVGAAIHSALPEAMLAGELEKLGLQTTRFETGPSFKVTGQTEVGGAARDLSFELHYAGARGGTWKGKHQFAKGAEDEFSPVLPGFEAVAPKQVLLFIAYCLAKSRVSIEKLYIAYADGIDRQKVLIPRPASASVEAPSELPAIDTVAPAPAVRGTLVKIKKGRKGAEGNVGSEDKRGDGSSGA